MNRFQLLLNQLSEIVGTPLYADKSRACRLNINDQLHVQLEDEEEKERVLVASFIHELPPGKYRENVLKEGLKANDVYPRLGTFSYSERNNQLTLSAHLYYTEHNADKAADLLANFIEKALLWKDAIARGTLPSALEPEVKVDKRVLGPAHG